MPKEQIIASLDVGSSKIRTVIALLEEDKKMPNIIGVGVAPSTGMRKGNIIDVDEAISNISAALEDAERMSGAPIHHVFVGINGNHVESFDSKGVIAISHAGSEIIEDDINRVLEAAQAVNMPSNRRILRIIPKSFSVDDQRGIKNPIGMIGVRLEVDAHIITGQSTIVKNVEKAVHQAGVDIDDIVPASLAAAEAVLSRRQKELGVVVIM
ncbi:cell division protein FtsA [Patescibacteria group bacterium]|nr:cell division protein FtsA [Patescibacteria group bacterium]